MIELEATQSGGSSKTLSPDEANRVELIEQRLLWVPALLVLSGILLSLATGGYGYFTHESMAYQTSTFLLYGFCGAVAFIPITFVSAGIFIRRSDFQVAKLRSNNGDTKDSEGEDLVSCRHCNHRAKPNSNGSCENCGKHNDDNILFAKGDSFKDERKGADAGIVLGFLMVAGATVWMVLAIRFGKFPLYAPVLLIIGLVSIVRGIRKKGRGE